MKRTLNLEISIWFRPEDKHIHLKIKVNKKERMSTISPDSNKMRGHPHLYNHLKEELEYANKWNREE